MRKEPMPLSLAVIVLIGGIILGSLFSFGMQYWNKEITFEECNKVQTQFLRYKENRRRGFLQEIIIDCANGERYFIDGTTVNSEVQERISKIHCNEDITLFIHPNSDTVVEFSTSSDTILIFSEAVDDLDEEANGFLYLGLFMYFCSLVGLYYVIWHGIQKRNQKR